MTNPMTFKEATDWLSASLDRDKDELKKAPKSDKVWWKRMIVAKQKALEALKLLNAMDDMRKQIQFDSKHHKRIFIKGGTDGSVEKMEEATEAVSS